MLWTSNPQVSGACEHFEREWQAVLAEAQHSGGQLVQNWSWTEWFAPELLALLDEFHDRPVRELAPLIRRLVLEQGFVDENGDSVIDEQEAARLDEVVELVLTALERVRQRFAELGRWSDVPVTPQMCG